MENVTLNKSPTKKILEKTYGNPLSYSNFISSELLQELKKDSREVPEVPGLYIKPLSSKNSPLEDPKGLQFVCSLYDKIKEDLATLLKGRQEDRHFIDNKNKVLAEKNAQSKIDYLDPQYETVIGKKNDKSEIIVGPLESSEEDSLIAELPPHLKGAHITLFGPSDSPKMSINAMNSWHRIGQNESEVMTRLVNESGILPMWGADDEDSKTPDIETFSEACKNLIRCFDRTLSHTDKRTGKIYKIKKQNLARPIKRPPGFGLPSGGHLYHDRPLPLHLFDFGMHLFHCRNNPEALTFYFPKLENEKEARYLKKLIMTAENMIQEIHPSYKLGTVRALIVFENPRAIFRIKEIVKELYPYFAGGSLGWHDYLASTARLFRFDPQYKIAIKADPNIVINHIKASHDLLVKEVGEKGGAAIGGMYGVLPESGNPQSFNLAMIGFIKDILIQLKRGLTGFWVAHPDFVRPGIALSWAFKKYRHDGKSEDLKKLIEALIPESSQDQKDILNFILEVNSEGLKKEDPLYNRSLLAATIQHSPFGNNNDPEEVRYNIYQALQYLVDWLGGNGCVALPATLKSREGDNVFVRVMDDLATTERSRWEVWAEIFHGRFKKVDFLNLLKEEIDFIRNDKETDTKKIQVRWDDKTGKWYSVAIKILIKLMTDKNPCEFATELLLPFTFDCIRNSNDPWSKASELDQKKYFLPEDILLFENQMNIKYNN